MHLFSGFLNVIILMGAVQGLLISILLFNSKSKANRLLSFLIFFIALASLNIWLESQIWYQSITYFQVFNAVVPMVIIMPIGPLLYFYIRSSLNPQFTIRRKDKSHFYAVLVDVLPTITTIVYIIGALAGFITSAKEFSTFLDNYNVYADIPRWLSLTIYLTFSYRYINTYLKQNKKREQDYLVKWLHQCVLAFAIFQVIWLIYLIPYIIPAFTDKVLNSVNWYPIYIPLTILIYWLGIKGYLVRQYEKKTGGTTTTLSFDTVEKTILLLKKSMEENKVYLDPELNLTALAQHTGIAPKIISTVLNNHLQISLNDFVNEYRISAFKEKYREPGNTHYTIVGIAFQCGFKSQATFQRAFKQFTGVPPSSFKNATP